MAVYLEDNPPARSQFRRQRRAQVTGAIVVHTAENTADTSGTDGGAEAVAYFIAHRSDAGSYHTIVDSDSAIQLCRYEWEAFHEGTGGNRWSLGLSFACRADQWPTLPSTWRDRALQRAAGQAADMARWVRRTTGIVVPSRRITAAEYRAGRPGFVGHAELDPSRRTDPGPRFPWATFLNYYATAIQKPPPPGGDPPMAANPYVLEIQQVLNNAGFPPGPVDGIAGPQTVNAVHALKNAYEAGGGGGAVNAIVAALDARYQRK